MNILIIGTTDNLGGAAKVSWMIKEALQKEGHEVSMLVADKRSDDPKVKIIPRQTWRKYLGFLLATDDFLNTDWILDTEEFKNADIVHCHNLHGRYFNLSTLQKMSQIKPVIWTLHDEWAITPHCAYTMEGKNIKNGLYVCPNISIPPRILWNNTSYLSWRKKKIYENAKLYIVTPSEWLLERVKKTCLGSHDIRLIHNGIDIDTFKKSDKREAREKLGLPQDKKIILFLANDAKMNTWKGPTYTLEVFKKLEEPSAILLSVGNLSHHESTNNIIYRGEIKDKSEIALYYSAADVLLFTSIAENFPLVILEAMSVSLPIVSFDVGGVKEVLEHKKHGFISPYKDIEGLIDGIKWIFSLSENDRDKMGIEAAKKVEKCYSSSHMINQYILLYDELT